MKKVKLVLKTIVISVCIFAWVIGNIDFIQRISKPNEVELVSGIVTNKLVEPTRSHSYYYVIINGSREIGVNRPTYSNAQIDKPITISVKHTKFHDQTLIMAISMIWAWMLDAVAVIRILIWMLDD